MRRTFIKGLQSFLFRMKERFLTRIVTWGEAFREWQSLQPGHNIQPHA